MLNKVEKWFEQPINKGWGDRPPLRPKPLTNKEENIMLMVFFYIIVITAIVGWILL